MNDGTSVAQTEDLIQDQSADQAEDQSISEDINSQVAEDTDSGADQQVDVQDDGEATEEQPVLSPRQQKAVDRVEAQAKEYGLNKILDRITQARQSQAPTKQDGINYRDVMDAPDEVYTQLEQDRNAVRNQGYNEGLEQVRAIEFKNNIRFDLPLVKDRMEQLDPADAWAIDQEYLLYSGFDSATGYVKNPDISYADFVNSQIDRAERMASKKQISSQKNIAKQAAQTGIRPDGAVRQGFQISNPGDISKLSPEEFEKNREAIYKQLGIAYK